MIETYLTCLIKIIYAVVTFLNIKNLGQTELSGNLDY